MSIAPTTVLVDKETFDVSLIDFVDEFWDSDYYETILEEKMFEKDVTISSWETISCKDSRNPKYQRNTMSKHPLPVLAFALPMHTNTTKHQTVEYKHENNSFVVIETSSITGVPFLDMDVVLKWTVVEHTAGRCQLYVTVEFVYKSLTLVQGLAEAISLRELNNLFEIWISCAKSLIQERKEQNSSFFGVSQKSNKSNKTSSEKQLLGITEAIKSGKSTDSYGVEDANSKDMNLTNTNLEKNCSTYEYWWGS